MFSKIVRAIIRWLEKYDDKWEIKVKEMKRPSTMGGIVPQGDTSKYPFIQFKKKKEVKFKVEKVYEFKKGGRYFFVIKSERPLTERMCEILKDILEANNKRLMKDLGIISSFILLDNGLDIKVVPSGEERKNNVV